MAQTVELLLPLERRQNLNLFMQKKASEMDIVAQRNCSLPYILQYLMKKKGKWHKNVLPILRKQHWRLNRQTQTL